jgi:hypothetical protein
VFLATTPEMTGGNPNDRKMIHAHKYTIIAFLQRSIPKGIKSAEGKVG